MNLSPHRLARYKEIGVLFLRYIYPAIRARNSLEISFADSGEEQQSIDPEKFAGKLEEMGPTFVKFGQLLSTRGDLLPASFTAALEHLQDQVNPLPYNDIQKTVEAELGVKINKAFASFEKKPLASASLAQVHAAVMRSGEEVVVKVQRPGIRMQIIEDIDILSTIATHAEEHTEIGRKYGLSNLVERLRRSLIDELNFEQEARNLRKLKEILEDFRKLEVPVPHDSFCTRRVLTMTRLSGIKVTDISGVTKTELDGNALAEEVFKAYLHQVLLAGFYHADPHPGNLLLTPRGTIALIDLGMVGRLSEKMQDDLFDLLEGISHNQPDRVGETAIRITRTGNHKIDRHGFALDLAELIGRTQGSSVQEMQMGSVLMEVMKICANHGLYIPREMSMLGKTMMNLDQAGIALSPEFNPNESMRRNLLEIARKRTWATLKPNNILSTLIQIKEFLGKSPYRLNEILDTLADNRLRIDVDAVDERALIEGFQKIANRITVGVIIASMIIAAAFMMRIESSSSLFGYPAFPILLFIAAGLAGLMVLINIFRRDI